MDEYQKSRLLFTTIACDSWMLSWLFLKASFSNPEERAAFKAFSVALLGLTRHVFALYRISREHKPQKLYSHHCEVVNALLWEILQHLGPIHTVFEAISSHQSVLCTQSPHSTSIYGYLESLQTVFHFCCRGDDYFDSSSLKCIKSKLRFLLVCIEEGAGKQFPKLKKDLDNFVLPAPKVVRLDILSQDLLPAEPQAQNEQTHFPHIAHSKNKAEKKSPKNGSSIPRDRGYPVIVRPIEWPSGSKSSVKLPKYDTLQLLEPNSPSIFPVKSWIAEGTSKKFGRMLPSGKDFEDLSLLLLSTPLTERDMKIAGPLILHEKLLVIAGELGRPKLLSAFLFQHRLIFFRKKSTGWAVLTNLRLDDITLVTFHQGTKDEIALRVYWRLEGRDDIKGEIDGAIMLFSDLKTLQLWAGFLALPRGRSRNWAEVLSFPSIQDLTDDDQEEQKSDNSNEDWATQLILQADVRKQTMIRYFEGW